MKVATLLLCMNDVFSFLLHHRVQRAFSQKSDEEEETTTRLFFFEAKRFLLRGTTTTSTRGTLRFFCPRRPRNEWISKSTSLRRRSDRRRKRREREHVRSRTQMGVRGNGASSFGLESLSPSLSLSLCLCVSFESNLGEHGNEDDDDGCSVQENAMSMIKYAFKNTIFRI